MDFKLINGDISILIIDEKYYDLNIEDYKETLRKLVTRAIKTKLGDLGIVTVNEGVELVDYGYGNAIFFELSEPLTISWVSRARQHILNALSFLPNTVTVISVNVSPTSNTRMTIDIILEFNNERINNLVTLYL
jgi:hypothetical protein